MPTRVRNSRGQFTVFLQMDRLVRLNVQLKLRTKEDVDKAAAEIQERASQLAPRDTGSLATSIYVTNGDDSDYAQRSGEARSLNPDAVILEELRPEFVISLFGEAEGAYVAVVGVAAGHGIFNELGTRFMSPQPFMLPAVEGVRDNFINDMKAVATV